jgi:hypothetical protein
MITAGHRKFQRKKVEVLVARCYKMLFTATAGVPGKSWFIRND